MTESIDNNNIDIILTNPLILNDNKGNDFDVEIFAGGLNAIGQQLSGLLMHPPAGAVKSSASAVGDVAKKALDQLMTNKSALDLVALAAKKLSLNQMNGRRGTSDLSDASDAASSSSSASLNANNNNNINSNNNNNNKGQYGQLAQMGLQLLANNLDSGKATAAAQFMLQNAAKSEAGSQMGRAALSALLSGAMVTFLTLLNWFDF